MNLRLTLANEFAATKGAKSPCGDSPPPRIRRLRRGAGSPRRWAWRSRCRGFNRQAERRPVHAHSKPAVSPIRSLRVSGKILIGVSTSGELSSCGPGIFCNLHQITARPAQPALRRLVSYRERSRAGVRPAVPAGQLTRSGYPDLLKSAVICEICGLHPISDQAHRIIP